MKSSNMEKYKNKAKHFTSFEKKLFLDILKQYKHIIEIKKSDCTTLKDKEEAWSQICNEYNASQFVTQERNVQQLKKFWANLKQNQRDALTKEKQSQMATGGGPPIQAVEIDPDIADIAPNLMTAAPVIFSSNLSNEEMKQQEAIMIDYVANDVLSNLTSALEETEDDPSEITCHNIYTSKNNDKSENKENSTLNMDKETQVRANKMPLYSWNSRHENLTFDETVSTSDFLNTASKSTPPYKEKLSVLKRGKRAISCNNDENEISLKVLRIQKLLDQEMELNAIKIEHEKKMSVLQEQHLIQLQKYELRKVIAAAESAELQLEIKKHETSSLL